MAASALHSFSSFRSQAMHPPPPVLDLRQKAAIGAVGCYGDDSAFNYCSAEAIPEILDFPN
jgi:hypothetical protein